MPGITLEIAQEKLTAYLAALDAVLAGQSYTIAGRSLTRANLTDIQTGIEFWNGKVNALERSEAGKSRAVVGRPGW